jgi:hypothetical protein
MQKLIEYFRRLTLGGNRENQTLDPWGFIAPELVEIEHHMLASLRLLAEHAIQQENADKRLVTELSRHVLDRLAVIDHLAIIVQELDSRILDLEQKQK